MLNHEAISPWRTDGDMQSKFLAQVSDLNKGKVCTRQVISVASWIGKGGEKSEWQKASGEDKVDVHIQQIS